MLCTCDQCSMYRQPMRPAADPAPAGARRRRPPLARLHRVFRTQVRLRSRGARA